MILRNGFNVYPREVECAIAELPAVESVSVSSIEHPGDEPDIVADVRGTVSESDVRQFCAQRLSAYKQPTIIRVS